MVMFTWRMGRERHAQPHQAGGLAQEFLEGLCEADPPIVRLPGTAIFLAPGKATTPLALRAQVEHNHAFHEKVVIVSLDPVTIPHVDQADRFGFERWAGACSRSPTSRSGPATGTGRTSPRRSPSPASAACWSATSTWSTPPTSSPG